MKTRRRTTGLVAAVAAIVGFGLASAPLTASHPTAAVAKVSAPKTATLTATYCKTLTLRYPGVDLSTVRPYMYVPVCYNGSQIWANGGVTPGVSLYGYSTSGFTWYGTYSDSGHHWLGAGENFPVTLWTGAVTFYCSPRWILNGWGNITSYQKNC